MPCPQSGLLFSACPIPATTPVSRKGQGSMALRKKSLNFCCGERGTASGLVVVLNVAMTPITRCFSCCLSCSSAFLRWASVAAICALESCCEEEVCADPFAAGGGFCAGGVA